VNPGEVPVNRWRSRPSPLTVTLCKPLIVAGLELA
jgi:hypothetical protein